MESPVRIQRMTGKMFDPIFRMTNAQKKEKFQTIYNKMIIIHVGIHYWQHFWTPYALAIIPMYMFV